VKRHDLVKQLETVNCVFIRHGGNHDWYQNPRTKVSQPVSRHREVNDNLAKHILKMLRDEDKSS
jgi:mRNA interferase HicA